MVFPLFATFYYWAPLFSRRALSERLGRWVFGLMFAGFNVAFLPMHLTGLLGMPRRVWTYPRAMGWDTLNAISTVGAFMLGAGILLFVIDLALRFRPGRAADRNPWDAGTLEWLPSDNYSARSIPHITSREPLWDRPQLPREVEDGRHYLPNAPTGGRETLVTSAIDAQPQYVLQMPGPGWPPVLAAFFTAGFFLLLTVKLVVPSLICGVLAIGFCIVWAWGLDPGPDKGPVEIGGGLRLPVYMTGPSSHAWWAMAVLMFVAASLYLSYVFSYLFLWTVSPEVWAARGGAPLPSAAWPLASAGLFVCAAVAFMIAGRSLGPRESRRLHTPALILLGAACAVGAIATEIAGHWSAGLRPHDNSYGAMVYLGGALSAQLVFAVFIMSLFAVARHFAGRLDRVRRASLETTSLLLYYTVGQAILGLVLVHGFPRVAG
jgi:cytochrome c oxidase subunit I+III